MKKDKIQRNTFLAVTALTVLVATPMFAHNCAEEIPKVQASIDALDPDDVPFGDKQMAEKQLATAKERLNQNDERSCLLYVESARSTVEAAQSVGR